ncbi:hypothetical protein BBP40_006132 [Aspergillus hancockii]|nr:hypothetical protein BBP40_006132 [Aspergillus hancockii]
MAEAPAQQPEAGGVAESTVVTHSTIPEDNQAMEDAFPQPTDSSEDIPHARGPRTLGVEDMGLQDGKGVEMTLEEEANNTTTEQNGQQDGNQDSTKGSADGDGDMTLDDAKGASDETAASASGGTAEGTEQSK